jgi:hypothetical protein
MTYLRNGHVEDVHSFYESNRWLAGFVLTVHGVLWSPKYGGREQLLSVIGTPGLLQFGPPDAECHDPRSGSEIVGAANRSAPRTARRRVAASCGRRRPVSLGLIQQFDDFVIFRGGCQFARGLSLFVFGLRVGFGGQQGTDGVGIAARGGQMQGS